MTWQDATTRVDALRGRLAGQLRGPLQRWLPALVPAAVFGAAVADLWPLAAACVLVGFLVTWQDDPVRPGTTAPPKPATEDALARAQVAGGDAVCIMLRLTDPDRGGAPPDTALADRVARIARLLRAGDHIRRRGPADIVIVLSPGTTPDLEDLVQLAARLQGAATAAGPEAGGTAASARVAVAVGCCRGTDLAAAPGMNAPGGVTPAAILDGAADALADALAEGPGTIRIYAPRVRARQSRRIALSADAARALDTGGFVPWFQPQVCTDTGRVSGVEALARWDHPEHGCVSPGDFLPVLEAAGLLERLASIMLDRSLHALTAWDAAGLDVPAVGVNLSAADLRDPRLVQRIAWMLDRHDLTGDRLIVEVLESVVADGGNGAADSPVLRNVAALADIGCGIDLDDFGTGHASITSLHRLAVARVKIDRSFVTGIDHDRDRQKMMMTILSMCEQLGLRTLAEGVETPGEHAMLAQLGCNHVQGFGIARPMPFAACSDWLAAHRARQTAILPPLRRHP